MFAAEEYRDTLTIILAGYRENIENSLIAYNPGLASRFNKSITFDDFTLEQFVQIWKE